MKNKISTILSIALLLFLTVSVAFAQGTHQPVNLGSTGSPYGYYEYLPQSFQQSGEKFPLLIFLHGAGEKGDGRTQLDRAVKFGPGREINQGKHFPFVILSPQTPDWWNTQKLDDFIDQAVQRYNVDRNRVYLTGLSMGAMGIYQYVAQHADKIAGIVPFAGSGRSGDVCNYRNVPLWAFHGDQDHVVPVTGSINIVNTYNNCTPEPPVEAKLTILEGYRHWGWNEMYNGSRGDIYNWLLQFSKNGEVVPQPEPEPEPIPEPNIAPVAAAGTDRVVQLPVNEVVFSGVASDEDGRIASFSWARLSGPQVRMDGSSTANLKLTNLQEGVYVFRFTVKDNEGAEASDQVQLEVRPAPVDEDEDEDEDSQNDEDEDASVIANAGSDRSLTLPVESTTLHGSVNWINCSVRSYSWEKVEGPSVNMSGSSTANLVLSRLQEGEYVFRFTALSENGMADSDEVRVSVGKGLAVDPEVEPEVVQGLSYSYYHIDPQHPWNQLPDLKNIQPRKKGKVDGFSLSPRERDDHFAFAYDGYIKINASGRYAFYTESNEGSKLYIDDVLVVNNDGVHEQKVKYGWVHLTSGYHKIRAEYFENTGRERMYLSYKGPGVSLQPIPANLLSTQAAEVVPATESAENGLNYAYYENRDAGNRWYALPDFSRLEPVKTGAVADFSLNVKESVSHFALLFEGRIKIEKSGDYTFYTNSDDGSQLFIDGQMVVQNDGWHAPQERSGRIRLSSGFHDIKVVYYEHEGWEVLEVKWSGQDFGKQIIPAHVLYKGLRHESTQAVARKAGPENMEVAFEKSAAFSLYPNPAQSEVNLSLDGLDEDEVTIVISDLRGKRLYRNNYSTAGKSGLQLDLEAIGLGKGAYVMTIQNRQQEMLKAIRFLKD